jgi:pilus assembly protein CpaF
VTTISEITGMEGPTVTMQDLFLFERQGYDEDMKVRGWFRASGIRPKFAEKLLACGIVLSPEMFERRTSKASRKPKAKELRKTG